MTTYGPDSGIAKDALFDHIVNKIDATRSGNSTGWDIIRDCRSATRPSAGTPTPAGFNSIGRKSKVYAPANIEVATGSGNWEIIHTIHKNYLSNVYYAQVTRMIGGTRSVGFRTSSDGGATWGAFNAYTNSTFYGNFVSFSSNSGKYVVSGQPDENNGSYSTLFLINNGFLTEGGVISRGQAGVLGYSKPEDRTSQPPYVNFTSVGELASEFQSPYAYTTVKANLDSNYRNYFFVVTGVTNDNLRVFRVLNSFTAITYIGNISAASLGVTAIYGVDYIVDKGTHHEMYISVLHSGVYKTIKAKTASSGVAAFDTLTGITVLSYDNQVGSDLPYDKDYLMSSVLQGYDYSVEPTVLLATTQTDATGTKVYSRALDGGVDSNPDYNNLQYEYVVFKSTYSPAVGNGYYMMLLQQNPEQVSPPTVAGITDKKPIFLRALRYWNESTNVPTKFLFDPIIPSGIDPTTIDLLGPALLTVPNPADSPSETHKVWLKVNSKQMFVFTETSGGLSGVTSQYLHYNVLDLVIPLDESDPTVANDNVCFSAAGSTSGKATLFLGRNGLPEVLDVRNTGIATYPLGAQVSYSSILNVQNAVDNKDYSFPVYVIAEAAPLLTSASSKTLEYVAGSLYQTLSYSSVTGLNTGDNVTIGADTYKIFKASAAPSANLTSDTSDAVAVLWA